METFDETSAVVLIATLVFFAGSAYLLLADTVPSWVRVATGVAAALLAIAALFALL